MEKNADLKNKLDWLLSSARRTKLAAEQWDSTPTFFNASYDKFQAQFPHKDFLLFEYSPRWVGKNGQLWNRLGLEEEHNYDTRFKKGTISHHSTVDAASYAAKIKGCARGWFGYSAYWDAALPTMVPTRDSRDVIDGIARRFTREPVEGRAKFKMNGKNVSLKKFYEWSSGVGSGWKFVQLKEHDFQFEFENYKPSRQQEVNQLKAKRLTTWVAVAELSVQGLTKNLIHGYTFPSVEVQKRQEWDKMQEWNQERQQWDEKPWPVGSRVRDVKAPHGCVYGRVEEKIL